MARPQKTRLVKHPPEFYHFKPAGRPMRDIEVIEITLDEYEAIRLADHKGLEHAEAAELMEISRSTFTRLVERARTKMARFLIEGLELIIEGGRVHFIENEYRCQSCGETFRLPMEARAERCPVCGGTALTSLARRFGHGECCRRRFKKIKNNS